MIKRADILVLGLQAAGFGGLVGGMLLFTGMNLVMGGQNAGWLLLLGAAPITGGIGLLLARRLARRLGL